MSDVSTLIEWDHHIKPHLQKIQHDAQWISFYTKSLEEALAKLDSVPQWTTEAQDELQQARKELNTALHHIDRALLSYRNKARWA